MFHTFLVGNRDRNHRKFIGACRRCHSEGTRKLVLMVRETPFHLGHLRTMAAVAEMGAIIAPPIPAFYHKPQSVHGHRGSYRGTRDGSARGSGSGCEAMEWARGTILTWVDERLYRFRERRAHSARLPSSNCSGPRLRLLPCQRFEEVFRALADGKVDAAVIPIENTLHGSVHENYDHLVNFELADSCRNERPRFAHPDCLSRRSVSKCAARVFASGRVESVRQVLSTRIRSSSAFRSMTQREA